MRNVQPDLLLLAGNVALASHAARGAPVPWLSCNRHGRASAGRLHSGDAARSPRSRTHSDGRLSWEWVFGLRPSSLKAAQNRSRTNHLDSCILTACMPSEPNPTDFLVCPRCHSTGYLRVSVVGVGGEKRLHFHCPCCRHVWFEHEEAIALPVIDYQPPMTK
jgi:hypothetical protein